MYKHFSATHTNIQETYAEQYTVSKAEVGVGEGRVCQGGDTSLTWHKQFLLFQIAQVSDTLLFI